LPTQVRGIYFYLYLFVDLFSRKIVGWQVYDRESAELAAGLLQDICTRQGIVPGQLVVHSDNGGPMKGETMLATMQRLGVAASRSRPSVSNDNPYSESLFSDPEIPTRTAHQTLRGLAASAPLGDRASALVQRRTSSQRRRFCDAEPAPFRARQNAARRPCDGVRTGAPGQSAEVVRKCTRLEPRRAGQPQPGQSQNQGRRTTQKSSLIHQLNATSSLTAAESACTLNLSTLPPP
jgi:putative transposase